jgi:hypothetical protein
MSMKNIRAVEDLELIFCLRIFAKIVPQAIPHLFRALCSYTNLTYLKLTHLTMAFQPTIGGLPIIPSLQSLHLGQVVFLQPLTVLTFILDPRTKVHLITIVNY